MRYCNIPGTDLKAAVLCMGGVPLIDETQLEKSFHLLDCYRELGGNFLDTANIYGKWLPAATNSSEIVIGKWLKDRGCRDRLILATKGGHPDLAAMHLPRLSRKDVAADLHESLKALQTDYIDLYWLHRDDEKTPVAVMLEYLNGFVASGKIRFFGCSNWKPRRIREAVAYARTNKIGGFVGNQVMWNLAVINDNAYDDPTMVTMDEDGLELHRETGLAVLAYSSQANGFFNKLALCGRAGLSREIRRIYDNTENLQRFARIESLSRELDKSITEIVLGYLLGQPFTTIPVVGCHTVAQLQDTMKAGDMVLPEKSLAYLEFGPDGHRK